MIEGLKPYAEYKESGLPWLGRCPRHWNVRRTKILFHERVQKGFPNEPLLAATQTKGVVKKEDYETRTVTAQKDLHLLKLVEVGDYVISLRSFQGGIEVAHCRGIISPAYTVLKPQKQAVFRYYSHFFKAKPFIDSLSLFVTGIREGQNIDYERLSRAEMPMPPEDEQAAIVRFVDHANRKIDGFIRAKRKLIGLLNEQKQAIIHRAVTGKDEVRMVKDENGNSSFILQPSTLPKKPSGIPWLGDIPKHWEQHSLWTLTKLRMDRNPGNLQLLSVFLDRGVIRYDEGGGQVHAPSLDLSNYQVAMPGDFVLNNQQAWRGSVGVSFHHGIISPAYIVLKLSRKLDPTFTNYLMRSRSMVDQFVAASKGVGDIQRQVFWPYLRMVQVPVPNLKEQAQIVEYLTNETRSLNTAIARTEREIALMQEYRTRLTADIVTGKLDVREAAAKLPELPADTSAEEELGKLLDEPEAEEEK
jgi:type I restriction enzyme S subunit